MPRNYFITGDPKAGKTTLLKQLVKELKKSGVRVGGFISPEERHHGTRTAFKVMDLESGKTALLASTGGDGPKVSKYHVDVKSFESIALPAMKKGGSCDVVVIDEIGAMELKSKKFAGMLDDLLESDTPVIATLHHQLAEKYGTDGEILEIDEENRSQVYERLLREAGSIKKKEKKAAKEAPRKTEAPKKAAPAKKAKAEKKPPKAKKEAPVKEEMREEKIEKREEPEEKFEEPKEEKKKGGLLDRIKKLFG